MRTTVTKIGTGLLAGAILTTMAIGPGSSADAVEPLAGQLPVSQYDGSQYDGSQYDGSQYDGSQYGGSQQDGSQYGNSGYGTSQPGSSRYGSSQPVGGQKSGYGYYHGRRQVYRPYTRPANTTVAPAAVALPTAARGAAAATSPAGQVLALINKVRSGAATSGLAMNAKLVASAHQHNLVMAGGCGLSHQCPGEGDPGARISVQGLRWNSYAENIGYGGPVAATEAGQAAMVVRITQSMIDEVAPNDGHRRNILNGSLGQIGIDVYREVNGTVWITQDFSN